jgi:hypothetical protein
MAGAEFLQMLKYYQLIFRNYHSSIYPVLLWLTGSHEVAAGIGEGVVVGLAVWLAVRRADPTRAAFLLIGTVLLFAPNGYSWYFTWIVPLLCFYPSPAWLLLTVLEFLSYKIFINYKRSACGISIRCFSGSATRRFMCCWGGRFAQERGCSTRQLRNLGRPQAANVNCIAYHFVVDHPATGQNAPVTVKSSPRANGIQSRKPSENARFLKNELDFLRIELVQQITDVIGPVNLGHYFRFLFFAKRRSTSACSETRPARMSAADLSIILINF